MMIMVGPCSLTYFTRPSKAAVTRLSTPVAVEYLWFLNGETSRKS